MSALTVQARRAATSTVGRRAMGVLLVVALLVLWELSWQLDVYRATSLPPISRILVALWAETRELTLPRELGMTLWRLLAGFGLASLIGVVVGVAMGASKLVDSLLEPLTELLRPIPVSALVPVAILFFGIHSEMKIAMITYAALWPVLVNTYSGVREIEPVLVDTARTFREPRLRRLTRIQLPAAAPYIAAGMRISLAISLVVAVVAEMIAGGDGIGSYLLSRQRAFQVAEMYAAIVTLAVLGYLLNAAFVRLEQRIVFWSPAVQAGEQPR